MPVSAAGSIVQTSDTCLVDTTPPRKLAVEFAKYGNFQLRVHGAQARDPLVIYLSNVEPDCILQIMNISAKPDACWGADAVQLPAKLARCLHDGRYGIVLDNKEAAKLGLKPGDIFEIRQVDASENASEPARVKLTQLGTGSWVRFGLDGRARDCVGVDLQGGDYNYIDYEDSRAPVVLTQLMKIEAGKADGKGVLSGRRAVEPGCTIVVRNEATLKEFRAVADENGAFNLEFEAMTGHPIHISAVDHNNKSTDLGMTPFAPKCAKGGQAAKAALDAIVDQAARA